MEKGSLSALFYKRYFMSDKVKTNIGSVSVACKNEERIGWKRRKFYFHLQNRR